MAQMEIKAPLGGVVVFVSNYNQGPLNAKPFKVGDNVYSGMNLHGGNPRHELAGDGRESGGDRPRRINIGKDVRVRVDASARAANPGQDHANFAAAMELSTDYPPTRSFRALTRRFRIRIRDFARG